MKSVRPPNACSDSPHECEDVAESTVFYNGLQKSGAKVEMVDKTKVLVIGWEKDGKFYPAVKGAAESRTIPKEKLPKVTVIGKKA